MTIAMSLLIHGEAVRFNRGQSRGDDYDFKYMRGRDGREFPYVSSQCYKRYWRESLPGPFSPITREKDASGKEKNQARTDGNPIAFVDDDLFGYMIAGAAEAEEAGEDGAEGGERLFGPENIKDQRALAGKLREPSKLSQFILNKSPDTQKILESTESSESDIQEAMLDALDEAARDDALSNVEGINATRGTNPLLGKLRSTTDAEKRHKLNKEILLKVFSRELQDKPKRKTTRRTAPIRMHALIAFSGIKTAKDFQTFSRDVAYTGKNSVVNPAAQGIYSGWLKTRILIESHRIGKFYVGENMDILEEQANGSDVKTELNPYSRQNETVKYVELNETERTNRLRAALRALADIGNRQGPASGALHDGSLRPKAFVAGMMNCADSPFDYIWLGHDGDGLPYLDVTRLTDAIKDWADLFAQKEIYFGLPAETPAEVRQEIIAKVGEISFDQSNKFAAITDTPRKMLLKLAEEAVL